MSNTSKAMDKGLQILTLLMEKKRVMATDIAETLKCSERTAQRHMQALSHSRFIEYYDKTKPYYIRFIPKHGVTAPEGFSETEYAFLSALFSYAEDVTDGGSTITELKNKIFRMERSYNRFAVIGDRSVDFSAVEKKLSTIEDAIKDRVMLSFTYTRFGERNYTVKPYRIVFVEGVWYLQAEHDGEYNKKFLVDCMDNIASGAPFADEPPERFDSVIKAAHTVFFEDDPAKCTRVRAEIKPLIADNFLRREVLPRQAIEEKRDDGSLVVSFDICHEVELHLLVLRWTPNIRIIEPEHFREYVIRQYEQGITLNRQT